MTSETPYALTSPWAEMWQNTEADATVLTAMLISKYGEEALDWDPLTIKLEIQADFHVTPPEEVMNKICAMQIVMASSSFFDRIDAFLNVCNALSEGDPFFEVFAPPETEEIAFALATVGMNRDLLPFSPTIQRYVKEVLKADGFDEDNFPPIFSAIFDKAPSAKEVREDVSQLILGKTAAETNGKNISEMLSSHIGVMFDQFNKVPGLTTVDNKILEQGMLRALGEEIDTTSIPE